MCILFNLNKASRLKRLQRRRRRQRLFVKSLSYPFRLLSPETKLTEKEWETIFEKSEVLSNLMDNYKGGINVVRNVEPFGEEYSDEIIPRRSDGPDPNNFGPPPINPFDTAQSYGFRNWLRDVLTSSEESSSSSEEYTDIPYRDLFETAEDTGSYFSALILQKYQIALSRIYIVPF